MMTPETTISVQPQRTMGSRKVRGEGAGAQEEQHFGWVLFWGLGRDEFRLDPVELELWEVTPEAILSQLSSLWAWSSRSSLDWPSLL